MNTLKAYSGWIVAALVAVFAVGGIAYAANTFSWSRVEDKTAANLTAQVAASTPLGATDGSDQVLGSVTNAGALPAMVCSSDNCTYTASGSFIDASTTIVSVVDPFVKVTSTGAGSEVIISTDSNGGKLTGATTTVDLVRLNITSGATSSFRLACGATSTPASTATFLPFAVSIVSTSPEIAGDSIPTSTIGVLENNVTKAQGAVQDVGTTAKIMMGSQNPYLICKVDPVSASAFTDGPNTFAGKYVVRFNRQRF